MTAARSVGTLIRRHRVTLALSLVLVLSWSLAVLGLQRAMLFPRYAAPPLADAGEGIPGLERLFLDTDDGRVEAYFIPGDGVDAAHAGPMVLFAHGNAELIDYWPNELRAYREMGVSVLLPEYRGYGRSAGSPSERAIREDFERFYDLAAARPDVDRTRIVFHGRSLGGGAVCALARTRTPRAIVLQSTFTSVADMARRYLVPRFLVLDPFDSLEVVRGLDVPVLVVHGRRDSIVPVEHAHELARAAKHAKLVLLDADHNDCPPDWRAFFAEVEAFLRDASLLEDR
jgi:pimeloyl-ACP methyl ester carboxylesterase